jgi:hypothetical protein
VKDVYLRYTYLDKHERGSVRWQFIFYKAKDQWIINAIVWDGDVNKLFEQVGVAVE